MIACPNKSSNEWIAMVDKLGEFEAYRAYARKGDLLTKEELDLAYLPGQGVKFLQADGSVGITSIQAIPELNIGTNRKAVVSATTAKLLDILQEKLGVEYQIIGGDAAIELTKNTANPWSGEKAFFLGGKVYLLDGAFGAEDALHEFIHPLVRAIKNENRALFDRLAAEAIADTEIATTIEELYGQDVEDLKSEEAIVRAVQKSVSVEDFQSKEGFVQKVLFAIKQMFRKLFGRSVKIETLSLDTKIADLAEMLKSESFQIDTDSINEEEYVAYLRANDLKIKEELEKVSNDALVQTVEDTFQMVTSQIRSINRNSKQKFIKDLLAEEGGRGLLQGVRESLRSVAGLDSVIEDAKTDAEVTSRRATQFVIALRKVEAMMKLIDSEITELSKLDTQEAFQKIHYLDNLTNSWDQLLTHASDILSDGGLKSTSELAGVIDTVRGLVERSQKNIVKVYTEASADMLWDTLQLVSENITNRLQGELRKAIDSNAPASKIKKIKDDIEKFSFNRNKIKAVLEGREGDTNPFSAFLESYINNPDLVVGGFAKYLKDNFTDVQIKTQSRVNEIASELEPVLKAAGYNANNPAELMKMLTFIDKKSRINDKGEIEEYEVIKLLNQFKNYESDRIRLNFEYEQLIKEGKNKEAREKKKEIQQWEKNYMHREYVDEFYEKNRIYDDAGDIGAEAKYEREKALEDINNELDALEVSKESVDEDSQMRLKVLQSEYSNLFSLRYADGTKKTGRDLEKAQLHRQYREESSKFYEQIQMTGMFEGALNDYLDGLIANGMKPGSPELEQKRQEWIEDNTRYAVDPEYYERKQTASAEISKILSKYPGSAELSKEVSDTYNEIVDLVSGFKDQDGQIVGTDMSDSRLTEIKGLQEKATLLRGKLAKISGLSVSEFDRLQELLEKKAAASLTDEEIDEMSILLQAKETSGMSMRDRGRLSTLYSELSKLQSKVATDYYVEQANQKVQEVRFNNPDMSSALFRDLTNRTADLLLQPNLINPLLKASPEFKAWFDANHVEVKTFDYTTGEEVTKYQRLFAWNRNVPAKEFVKNTTLSTGEIIPGIPKRQFFYSSVKKQYRTQKVVGTTVDNRGYWLPKTVEQGAIDDKYINQDYAALKRDKPAEFKALETLTKIHLENQVGSNRSAKLYLEIPRFRKQNLEYLQSSDLAQEAKNKVNGIVSIAKAVKSQFVGAADDAEAGYNFDKESFDLVSADMFDHEISGIPVSGKYRLEVDQVSLDVVGSMVRYMMSVERQKKLIEINPHVKALQKVLRDPRNAVKDMGKINRSAYIYRGLISPISKSGKSVRSKAIDNLIEREFEGVKFTGLGSESTAAQKISNTLFGLASFRFFAGNIPSALKNRFGAIIQNNIEAIGGSNFNSTDYAKGKYKGWQVTSEISSQIYSKTPKSLNVQIVEVFDPVQGRFQQKAADLGARTWLRDLAEGSVLFSPRKFLELEGSMEFFFSMMHGQKVPMTQNGQTRMIDYADAWEIIDGQLTLKEGVDASWDKGGASFKLFVNKTHDLMNKLQGTYSQFDQPEAQRYLAFRYFSFLRRYFTSMFMHRFGNRRFNAAGSEISAGYYREFGNFIVSFFRGLHEGSFYYTESERSGALKTLAEVGQLVALSLVATFAFGFDLDDEDKYEKLRQRSGAAPLPGVAESEYEFDFGGWLMNHALYQTLLVQAENRQFIPLPSIVYKGTQFGFGLNDYSNFVDAGSVVTGPTFGAYASIVNDVVQLAGDDDRAFYGRDMGPFEFQQKGEAKILNHLAKLVGVKGTTVDPTEGVKTFISVEARNK